MTWPAKTYIKGNLWDADQANEYLRDPLNDLRAGGLAMSGQVAHSFIAASSSTQLVARTPAPGRIPRFNGVTGAWEFVTAGEHAWPVGIIFRSFVATNPNLLLGIGVWALFGGGLCTVAYDAAQLEFDSVMKQGGSKTHTVTITELPSHTHTQDAHNHTQNPHNHTVSNVANVAHSDTAQTPPPLVSVVDNSGTKSTANETATNTAATAVNQNTGGGGAHANLMPYIVQYVWVRTA